MPFPMRWRFSCIADPRKDGSTKLLASIVILDWNEQPLSAFIKLRIVWHKSMIVLESFQGAVRSAKLKLPSRAHLDQPGVFSVGRFLVLMHELRSKIECNIRAPRLELQEFGSVNWLRQQFRNGTGEKEVDPHSVGSGAETTRLRSVEIC